MDTLELCSKFERMGARLRAGTLPASRFVRENRGVSINIRTDRHGEYFELLTAPRREFRLEALDVRPRDRHLLLMVQERNAAAEKHKFLCGHDERAWFVAAVPGRSASTVVTAMEALKPWAVVATQGDLGVKLSKRNRRKNLAFVRQGEWFFVPQPMLRVDPKQVLPHERLVRSTGGKPHWAEFAWRSGGETVYVSARHPAGLSIAQFTQLYGRVSPAKHGFTQMTRNANVFVTGRISHPDHKTITLRGWHRVLMNTENQSASMRHVTFLD